VNAVTATGETPAHAAAQHGGSDALTALLAEGADWAAVNTAGVAPLHWAAVNGHASCVVALLAAGAQVSVRGGGVVRQWRGGACGVISDDNGEEERVE
jgi:ankyrin repeat protein